MTKKLLLKLNAYRDVLDDLLSDPEFTNLLSDRVCDPPEQAPEDHKENSPQESLTDEEFYQWAGDNGISPSSLEDSTALAEDPTSLMLEENTLANITDEEFSLF